MTTGKTIALTRRTFVGKVMSLLLNMLSRLVITFLPRSKSLVISWLQSPSAVILEPQKIKSDAVFTVSPYRGIKGRVKNIWNFFIYFGCQYSVRHTYYKYYLVCALSIFFLLHHLASGIWVPSARDWTQALYRESGKSQPLDHQGIPFSLPLFKKNFW